MPRPKQDEHGNYWCGRCKTYKPLDQFYPAPKSYRSNRSQNCKECGAEAKWVHIQKHRLLEQGPIEFQKQLDLDIKRITLKQQLLTKYLKGELK